MDSNDLEASFTSRLPPEIVTALKRKSSRDPNSRFPRKLHMLLTYLASNPQLEEEIGLSWISDTEFKMKKKNVALVMGIKLNTLNVNLRDLAFEQLQHDKGGWTQWKRSGFTRNSVFEEPPSEYQPHETKRIKPETNKDGIKSTKKTMCIGNSTPNEQETFRAKVDEIWYKLTQKQDGSVLREFFVDKAADFFKQPEQPKQNAIEVISAIMAPQEEQTKCKADLYKFLAMFGPYETIMLKIASLLQISNNKGHWLTFEPQAEKNASNQRDSISGWFDQNEPNCLILKTPSGIRKIWNKPLIEATGQYLMDEDGGKYDSWDKYFDMKPIEQPYLPPYPVSYGQI